MWNELTRLSDDENSVIAQLPTNDEVGPTFSATGLDRVLDELGASDFFYDEEAVNKFVVAARETKKAAYEGVVVASRKNAKARVTLENHDLLASICVTGAYGGRGLSGPDILHALASAKVVKGINKLALKKVLDVSNELGPGEEFIQPVAVGEAAKHGKDARFIPLVDDVTERVLKPQSAGNKTGRVDMRDLGELVTVQAGQEVLKRIPATKGKQGFTVLGAIIQPLAGKDAALKASKGTEIDKSNPNLLRASISGMPIIKKTSVEVDPALNLKNIDISTGHIKFKGSVVVSGNIEPGMIVRATGSITVGGFIESADVQAQEDIVVGKGIIGHAVDDGEDKACIVKTNGNIKSKYAQFAFLQAMGDVELELHSMNNTIMCTGNLTVLDSTEKKGTLSGGLSKVGGKIVCANLGVEGDTATFVQPFVRFNKYKQGLNELKERYTAIQNNTMDVIRKEMEFKKLPKSERDPQELEKIEALKAKNEDLLTKAKAKREWAESELERLLEINIVEAKEKVFTRVTVQYGDEVVITKREHNAAKFSFDQYSIHCSLMVEGVEEDEAEL